MALMNGVFNTQPRTGLPAELAAKSLASTLMRLFPNGASPILGMSSMMGTTTAKSSTHGYFSKTAEFTVTTVNANYSIGAATIVVADASGLAAGDLIHNVTSRENMRITAVAGNTLTVTKAFGRVADSAGTSGQRIILSLIHI